MQDSTLNMKLKLEFYPSPCESKIHVINHNAVMLHFLYYYDSVSAYPLIKSVPWIPRVYSWKGTMGIMKHKDTVQNC